MLIPVILSGGTGTRLWPVSREAFPKPFISAIIVAFKSVRPALEQAIICCRPSNSTTLLSSIQITIIAAYFTTIKTAE